MVPRRIRCGGRPARPLFALPRPAPAGAWLLGALLWAACQGRGAHRAAEHRNAEPAASGPRLEVATMTVGSVPEGAEVLVDGDLAGNAPLVLELPPGEHHIEVRAPGHRPARRSLRLRAGDSEAWTVRLRSARIGDGRGEGRLSLESRPTATVRLEGEVLGRTPLEAVRLPSGTVPLEFELPDGTRVNRSVYVPLDGHGRVFVDLTRAQRR